MNKRILVIAAHPDDEVLGCGGTIARHNINSDNVGVVFIADGVGARNDNFAENLQKRKQAAESALNILGALNFGFFDFPDNRLDTIPLIDIVQKLEGVIEDFQPEIVYTHHSGDLNIDHQIVNRATLTACRPLPESTIKAIYAYEVISSTEWSLNGHTFLPNYFVNIDLFFEKKVEALNAYEKEMRLFPHTRSIEHVEALAIHRGSSVGFLKAEAFQLIRKIK